MSLLNLLRQTCQVDCDTMDAIAYFELVKPTPENEPLIAEAKSLARGSLSHLLDEDGDRLALAEFVVEILTKTVSPAKTLQMVQLQLRFANHTTGFLHVQTNPKLSYSTEKTVRNARRLISIFNLLAPTHQGRIPKICIKIPATWEGLQACRVLHDEDGAATLATTMFCMEQAVVAAAVKCTYIAPYVNELKVHFEKGYIDHNKSFDLCRQAQSFFLRTNSPTQVLAASLTSLDEVMHLAGIQHITISPRLLDELAATDAAAWTGNLGEYFAQGPDDGSWDAGRRTAEDAAALAHDESAWRLAFTRSGFGASEAKIIQAINYFADFQDKLEALVEGRGS
ncbi:hypothetical protein E4U42_001272 [Claviceps africana]|uniref:Transaldolase n=1 Tax=Claviceps africana TaxID=83212 RepID=A0A8K0J013_9HYPO|nr:hypothetical protein E4U42_001272 [Claviceps africana]